MRIVSAGVRARATLAAVVLGATVAACSAPGGVATGTAAPTPTAPSTTEPVTVPTTDAPASPDDTEPVPTTEAPPDTLPDPAIDVDAELALTAGRFEATVRPVPIASPDPATGYDGMHSIARLPSGGFIAIGFDAEGDGEQAERSGVWLSDDGASWRRSGREISEQPGQQALRTVLVDGATIMIVGTDLGVADVFDAERLDAYVYTSDDGGETWDQELIGSGLAVTDDVLGPDGPVIAVLDATQVEPLAEVVRFVDGRWRRTPMPSLAGGLDRASGLVGLTLAGDTLYAFGSRTTDDPAVDSSGPLDVFGSDQYPPTDAAVWRSDDGGATWAPYLDADLQGQPGTQGAMRVIDTPDGTYLVTVDAPEDDAPFVLRVWKEQDGRWVDQLVDLGTEPEQFAPSVLAVHTPSTTPGRPGALTFIVSEFTGRRVEGRFVLYDLESRDTDGADAYRRTRFEQPEDVVAVEDVFWVPGRLERGPTHTDLQLMELQVGET